MDFALPPELVAYLDELDRFIAAEIAPLQLADDNERFFDHRREWARTDFDQGGLPRPAWEALLREARQRADAAGHLRFALPVEYGGRGGSNLWMAVIREHLADRGLGLFNDLQSEHSVVGNFPLVHMMQAFGNAAQKAEFIPGMISETHRLAFGLTEPEHGSDATHMETRAVRALAGAQPGWRIDGSKMWITGMHIATHCVVFARTSGPAGDARGISAFLVPAKAPGLAIEEYLWTFNMPTDHPRISLENVWVPDSALLGPEDGGLALAQAFVHENRIRQAASSLGAATYCIRESIRYARERKPFGRALAENQGIQFPLVELATQAEMLRQLIRKTAWEMDGMSRPDIAIRLAQGVDVQLLGEPPVLRGRRPGDAGTWGHRLLTAQAFEHLYRHHRRYRITEGSEEIQMRKVAGHLFGFLGRDDVSQANADAATSAVRGAV